jgi:hypothetical protein
MSAPGPSSSDAQHNFGKTPWPRKYDPETHMYHDATPPIYNPDTTAPDVHVPFDPNFEEAERRWRERPQLKYVLPAPYEDDKSYQDDDDTECGEEVDAAQRLSKFMGWRSERWYDIHFDDWQICIGVWLMTALFISILSGVAAVIYILVK